MRKRPFARLGSFYLEKDPGIIRLLGSKFARPCTLMQFPWRCACLACGNHLVGVYILAHRILRKLRRRPQMFGRRPTVTIVIDVQLDTVAVGILVIKGGL